LRKKTWMEGLILVEVWKRKKMFKTRPKKILVLKSNKRNNNKTTPYFN